MLCQVLHIDCANGVGASKISTMTSFLTEFGLEVDLRNTGEEKILAGHTLQLLCLLHTAIKGF